MSTTTATAAGLPPPLLPDIFFAVAALKSFKHTITLMFFFRRDGTQELSQAYDHFDVFFCAAAALKSFLKHTII